MTSGIRSRRLAHAIAADLPVDLEPAREQLRLQIARMGVAGWRARYDASAAEVLDLLDFTRVRNRSLLRTLLETGNVTVDLPAIPAGLPAWDSPADPGACPGRTASGPPRGLRRGPAHCHRRGSGSRGSVSDPRHRPGHRRGNHRQPRLPGIVYHPAARRHGRLASRDEQPVLAPGPTDDSAAPCRYPITWIRGLHLTGVDLRPTLQNLQVRADFGPATPTLAAGR